MCFNLGAGVSGFEGSECMVQVLRLGISSMITASHVIIYFGGQIRIYEHPRFRVYRVLGGLGLRA